ncbi:hypothetical protein SBA3_360023 [Candidatus Sulfopaludibacter sp. SbA3]|nr:hypothetical protein SBA3_360023 [Candidatus Sulfopaludibacter sp. SbA3]
MPFSAFSSASPRLRGEFFPLTMEPIIETRDLTRRFAALTAVDHLNLTVSKGEIFGLVGPDGAGKTTTLRMLCGLMDPSEGSARVAGHDVTRESQAVKDQIGYMAQRFGLYADLTVQENMDFYADLFDITGAERQRLTVELLRMTRMDPFRGRQAGRLSGGMNHVHPVASPPDFVSGRAHERSRPRFPPRFLGHTVPASERRHHHLHDHRVSRRGRALQSRGPDAQGQADSLRPAGRHEARHRRRLAGSGFH